MSFKGIYWKGTPIIIPGAYAYVDASGMAPNNLSPANTIGAVGICTGGKPQTPLFCTSMQDASILRSGDLFTAAQLMYNPSSEVPGAGNAYFIRVNNATQAEWSNTYFTIFSKDYGKHTNFIRFQIATGTITGFRINVQDQSDNISEYLDNWGNAFSIQYTGTQAAAQMLLTSTSLTIETSPSATTPVWTTYRIFDLTSVELATVGQLVTTIAGDPNLTATLDPNLLDQGLPSTSLDQQSAGVSIMTPYTVTAYQGILEYWSTTRSQLITVTAITPQPSTNYTPTVTNWTNLTGGSEGPTPQLTDWQNAINQLANLSDVKIVYVATNTPAIQAMALEHCDQMSALSIGQERILVCGSGIGDSVATTLTNATNLGDPRAVFVYPGVYRYNLQTGNLDLLGGYLSAAIVAGMAGGTAPQTPLTNKTIYVQGLEQTLSVASITQLLNGGVTPLVFDKSSNVYKIVQAITTYQIDGNPTFRKFAGMRIADYIKQETRNSAKAYIGSVGSLVGVTSVRNAIAAKLDLLTITSQNPDGVLTPATNSLGQPLPAWSNLVVTYDGIDWVNVSFVCHPVGEIDYITITAMLQPATMTINS